MSVQAASQTLVEESAGGMTRATNRMIGGIASYARWPDGSLAANRQMCVVGTPRLAPRMAPAMPGRGSISVRPTTAAGVTPDRDLLIPGRMPVADRRPLIEGQRLVEGKRRAD